MYSEDNLLPLSALQHLLFCERRAALVHIEQMWEENSFTLEGQHLHERADKAGTEACGDIRIARGLRLRSLRLGLIGITDVVEFHKLDHNSKEQTGQGITLDDAPGIWHTVPVEYKRGRLRHEEGYEIQLCAQALCLEEMLCTDIPKGMLYFGKTRRRLEIAFDKDLRARTESAASRLHELIDSGVTPRAVPGPKCRGCSMLNICMPKASSGRKNVHKYLSRAINDLKDEEA